GVFNVDPRGFCAFIAVGPVGRQAVVRARINQLEAAAATRGPLAPASPGNESDLVLDHVNNVSDKLAMTVRSGQRFGPGQGNSFAVMGQCAAEITQGILGTEAWVFGEEVGQVS